MSNYISISNNTVQMIAFYVAEQNRTVPIKLIPGLNLGIKSSHGEELRKTSVFNSYVEKGWLTYLESDNVDTVENAKEKFGKKLLDDPTGQPVRATFQEELSPQNNKPYYPTKELLVSLNGVGKKTADKIIAAGEERGGWKSYSDMADNLSKDYPGVEFVPEEGVS